MTCFTRLRRLLLVFTSLVQSVTMASQVPLDINGLEEAQNLDCIVRAWVRAPDLVPGEVIHGEINVETVGACDGVVSYELGLRFRERGALKLPRRDVELPELRMEACGAPAFTDENVRAMRNTSFWVVKEQERVGFDIRATLEVQQPRSNFAILVPRTNFPPAPYTRSRFERVAGTFKTEAEAEHRYEYFLTISFLNGTVEEVYCGHTAFIPRSTLQAVEFSEDLEPVTVALTSIPGLALSSSKKSDSEMEVQILLPRDRIVFQGSYLTTIATVLDSSMSGQLTIEFSSAVVDHKWGKEIAAVHGFEDVNYPQMGWFTKQLTAHGSVHSHPWGWDFPATREIQAHIPSEYNATVQIPKEAFPTTELYYASYSSALSVTFHPEIGTLPEPLEGGPEHGVDERVPWTAGTVPKSIGVRMAPKCLSAMLPLTVHPLPSLDPGLVPVTHYLSEGSRSPVFIDPSHVDEVAGLSAAQRDAIAPLTTPVFIDIDPEIEQIRLAKFYVGSAWESLYVGETWQRQVIEEGIVSSSSEKVLRTFTAPADQWRW